MHDTKPLSGIRVLDFGTYLAGPYAGGILASLGAEVVKIEFARGGDPFRRGEGVNDPYFIQMNAGKKSLAVDLKAPEGVALIKSLVPHFDVLLENTRPGKMDALGLGPDEIRRLNPSMIYSSVSGFGEGGPWRDRAAYDTIGLSMSGFLSIMSNESDVQLAGTCIGDLTGALIMVIGILSGLVARRLTPEENGTLVQTSLLEAMSTITIDAMTQVFETGKNPSRESRHPTAQSFCLKTSDGAAIAVHLSGSEKFWMAFAGAIGRPELAEDPRFLRYNDRKAHYFELRPIVEAEFVKLDRDEWERRLTEADVPYAPVLTAQELPEHPQMQWLDMYEPENEGMRLVRLPWRFSGHRPHRPSHVPEIGEHSREVALQVLRPPEVDRLIDRGILVQASALERA